MNAITYYFNENIKSMRGVYHVKNKDKRIAWYMLAFMAFSTVWGFGNVINGFSEYEGLKAIVSWIIIFAIYFVPYALMVGELGSAFKDYGEE